MNKNRIRGGGRRTSGQVTAKCISIKYVRRRSGGSVRKVVELTSRGLHRVPCGSLDPNWTARAGRRTNTVQKSAAGIVAVRRLPRRNRAGAAAKAQTE